MAGGWPLRALIAGIALLLLAVLPGEAFADDAKKVVFVTSNGWHSGIAIARADLPENAIPETEDFPHALYFEFGWGDAEYYPSPKPTFGMALTAAFPGPAVVHLSGLPAHPAEVFPGAEAIPVALSDDGLDRLVAYLHDGFKRGGAARVESNAPGIYTFSRFYPATGEFHLFNTCNTWIARALAAAGLPVQASGTQRAEDLMSQVRPLAYRP